jgi:hypothetical protein
MVKKLVRLALACEFSRQPLRRVDITTKVLAPNGRAFKHVFKDAQDVLRDTFGMAMTELPIKEKITTTQKRAAQRAHGNSQGGASSSNAYILTSTLPASFRIPEILPPSKIPSVAAEASYTGLYSFIISVIYLTQGGRISENKLERVLGKVNASQWVAGDKLEKMLKRMEKEGYIVKIRDREAGGEETVEWIVGPRGKVEVGERGVAGLVTSVYGKRDMELEELEDKLEKSLGVGTFKRKKRRAEDLDEEQEDQDDEATAQELPVRTNGVERRQSRRHRVQDEGDEEEEDGAEEDGDEEEDEDDDE